MFKKVLIMVSFLLFLSGMAYGFEFSADTIFTSHGAQKMQGKMYFKPDRFRMDMKMQGNMHMITRIDKKVIWNVMPAQRIYMEMPFNLQNKPKVDEKFEGEISRKLIGTESVDGHPAKKYLITYKANNRTEQVYQWWATDINFPVKTAAVDGSWSQEFRNVKIGPQPDSLFEVPAGYQKMQMPSMPGGMNFQHMR